MSFVLFQWKLFDLLYLNPLFGFGWNVPPTPEGRKDVTPLWGWGDKPFFGFGWIETN